MKIADFQGNIKYILNIQQCTLVVVSSIKGLLGPILSSSSRCTLPLYVSTDKILNTNIQIHHLFLLFLQLQRISRQIFFLDFWNHLDQWTYLISSLLGISKSILIFVLPKTVSVMNFTDPIICPRTSLDFKRSNILLFNSYTILRNVIN